MDALCVPLTAFQACVAVISFYPHSLLFGIISLTANPRIMPHSKIVRARVSRCVAVNAIGALSITMAGMALARKCSAKS